MGYFWDQHEETRNVIQDFVEGITEELKDEPIGWICPICGRGNSPYNLYCSCKYNSEGYTE